MTWMRMLIMSVGMTLVVFTTDVKADYPDGTIVYSSKPNHIVGRVAQRWATRAQGYRATYTHVGIVLGGRVYHADYPRVEAKPIGQFKRGEIASYSLPARQYTPQQVAAMTAYAQSQLGQPYRLRGFIRGDGSEGWCSTFVKNVLNRAGHNLTYRDGFTPDNLLRAIR